MSKYSVEEVRIEADELRAAGYDSTADMMIAFAKRIKAYESAVPIGWQIRIGDSDSWGFCRYECDADFLGRQSGLQYEKRPLFDHPPAQAEQVDEYAAGWRQAARWAKRDDLLADIGSPAYERDKALMLRRPTAEPAITCNCGFTVPDVEDFCSNADGDWEEHTPRERNVARALVRAHMIYAKSTADNQPRAVPNGWALVPVEATTEMLDAGYDQLPRHMYGVVRRKDADPVWDAMLAAAPSPETKA